MKNSIKLILAAAAAMFAFSSCASHKSGGHSAPTPPANDGGSYSSK